MGMLRQLSLPSSALRNAISTVLLTATGLVLVVGSGAQSQECILDGSLDPDPAAA